MQIQMLILLAPAILIALTVHEYAHGWVAFRLGDPTARNAGRLTLNPLAHLDPIGTIVLVITTMSHLGSFGWAKPVPVNHYNFSRPRRDSMLVSLAGPFSNILTALAFGFIYNHAGAVHSVSLLTFCKLCVVINIGLAFFNLLPVPPLDGSHILLSLLPNQYIPGYITITRYVPIAFLILIIAERSFQVPLLSYVLDPLFIPFQNFLLFIINAL